MPKPRKLKFTIHSQAWYASPVVDPESVSVEVVDGLEWKTPARYLFYAGGAGELMLDSININYGDESVSIDWVRRNGVFVPRLTTYSEDWVEELQHPALASLLGHVECLDHAYTPRICAVELLKLGLKDGTRRKQS